MEYQIFLLKQTLERLGFEPKDISNVLSKAKPPANLEEAIMELQALQEQRKLNMSPYGNFQRYEFPCDSEMIVISSDSDEPSDTEIHPAFTPTIIKESSEIPTVTHTKPTTSSGSVSEALQCAYMDMPSSEKLHKWFLETYMFVPGATVSKEDIFRDFCEHFLLPSYPELSEVFLKELSGDILSKNPQYIGVLFDNLTENAQLKNLQKEGTVLKSTLPQSAGEFSRGEYGKGEVFGAKDKSKVTRSPGTLSSQIETLCYNKEHFHRKETSGTSSIYMSQSNEGMSKAKPLSVHSDMSSNSKHILHFPASASSDTKCSNIHFNMADDRAPATKHNTVHKVLSTTSVGSVDSSTTSVSDQLKLLCQPSYLSKDVPVTNQVSADQKKNSAHSKKPFNPTDSSSGINTPSTCSSTTKITTAKKTVTPTPPVTPSRKVHNPGSSTKKLSTKELLNLPNVSGKPNLRPIIIDGSNVACSHGNGTTFSCRGIAICVRYFWQRGHREITCFVPNFRKGKTGNPPITGQEVLFDLEKKDICKFTPSRVINGKQMVCYDDRFILRLAEENDGIIVTNDQYRDLKHESKSWRRIIDTKLLLYTFVKDLFMPPEDPLGRSGPKLDEFLSFHYTESSQKQHSTHRVAQDSYNISVKPTAEATTSHVEAKMPPAKQSGMKMQLLSLFPHKSVEIEHLLRFYPHIQNIDVFANFLLSEQ